VILRGGHDEPNYDAKGVAGALALLRRAGLPERLVIDASHDNSRKDPSLQPQVVQDVAGQIADGNRAIVGVMLESFLVAGRQELASPEALTYGQSITDGCIDWGMTVELLDRLADAVRTRRSSG
jgi:3-deoxy-7-phosphoheptulonate synthase